ncbi:uncharacterized protein [Triticum aestivum]|uniref:uncharacterized protein isoform X1 n=1 Tax=Triticum aestivum TaxID=4565 RepID=UPI001D004D9C|nr:uncharacterized protein LOC123132614 isoform X1 [Triticum aestivum]XP_044408385.1 uncharacterized protein LOC123132614 isoform X1 [Triticum aestivum]XP_044408386.1 uncharacterized protein LOC123132614 isoform X1 [Triticum aestivum]
MVTCRGRRLPAAAATQPSLPRHHTSAMLKLLLRTLRHSRASGRDLRSAPTIFPPKKEPSSLLAMAWPAAASRGSASAPPNACALKKNQYSSGGRGRRTIGSAVPRPATCPASLLVTTTLLPRLPARRRVCMIASTTCLLRRLTLSKTARNLSPRSFRSRSLVCSPSAERLVAFGVNRERGKSAVSPAAMRLMQWKSSSMTSEKRRRTAGSSQTCCTSVVFPRPAEPIIGRTPGSASVGSPSSSCSKNSKTRRLSTCRTNIWLSA